MLCEQVVHLRNMLSSCTSLMISEGKESGIVAHVFWHHYLYHFYLISELCTLISIFKFYVN
jgi:hypothetical protein